MVRLQLTDAVREFGTLRGFVGACAAASRGASCRNYDVPPLSQPHARRIGEGTKRVPEASNYADAALWEREEILQLAERSAGIGVWDIDMATGMLRGRPQLFHLLGLQPTSGPVPI